MEKISDLQKIKEQRNILGNWISIDGEHIYIYHDMCTKFISIISLTLNPIEKVIEWLNLFGFNFQYVKPRIITEEEKAFAIAYKKGFLAREKDMLCCYYFEKKPERGKSHWLGMYQYFIPKHLFPWLTWEDEPINVEDIK